MSTQILHISWLHIQHSFTLKKKKTHNSSFESSAARSYSSHPATLSSIPAYSFLSSSSQFLPPCFPSNSLSSCLLCCTHLRLSLSPIRLSVGGSYVTPHWTELYRCLSLSSLHHPCVSVAKSLWSSTPSVSLGLSDHVYRWRMPKWPPFISGGVWS